MDHVKLFFLLNRYGQASASSVAIANVTTISAQAKII